MLPFDLEAALGLERRLGVAVGRPQRVGQRHAELVTGDGAHGDGELDGPAVLLQRRDRLDVPGRPAPPAHQRRNRARVAGEHGQALAGEGQLEVVLAGLGRLGADEVAVAHVDEKKEGALLDVALEREREVGVLAAGVEAFDLGPVVGETVEDDGSLLGRSTGKVGGERRRGGRHRRHYGDQDQRALHRRRSIC